MSSTVSGRRHSLHLPCLRALDIVCRERHVAHPFAGRRKQHIRYSRPDQCRCRLADAARFYCVLHQGDIDSWHVGHAHHGIFVEFRLLHAAFFERVLSAQRCDRPDATLDCSCAFTVSGLTIWPVSATNGHPSGTKNRSTRSKITIPLG